MRVTVAPSTITTTLTTSPITFIASQVFDLGGPKVVQVKLTVLSVVADGEVFGQANGQISVGSLDSIGRSSFDGVTWQLKPLLGYQSTTGYYGLVAPGDAHLVWYLIARYLRVGVEIQDTSSASVYAGGNQPTATGTIEVNY